MHKLCFYIKIYFMILKQDIKSKMSFQTDFLLSMIGIFIMNVAGVIEFWVIFQNFPSIKGWNYYEFIFMYAFSLLAMAPAQCFFENNWNLANNVYTGDFIKYCIKPVNIFFYYMSEIFDLKGVTQFFTGQVLLIYAWKHLNISLTTTTIVLFLLSWTTAAIFMISIMTFASAVGFYFLNSDVLMTFVFKLKDYARYPVTIFGPVLKFTFSYIIPLAYLVYYPCVPLLRVNDISIQTVIGPIYGIILFLLTYKFWMHGAKLYSGTGN